MVLLNAHGELLMIRGHDPADRTRTPWWEIPGGGIDPGETSAQGAARELYEETGLDAEMGPCIWRLHNVFDFGGIHFDQQEYLHLARLRAPDGDQRPAIAPTHLEWLEAQAFGGHQWWTVEDLLASPEPTLPPRLREFLPAVVAGDVPATPIDIGTLPLDAPL